MSDYSISFIVLLVIYLAAYTISHTRKDAEFQKEREEWKKERQMLLDRIQAPTFAEYTNKVIKEKKLEQPKDEQESIEFVS